MLVLMLSSCVKRFEPVIENNDAVKFVVIGQVTKGDSVQRVNISMTSPISKPKYIPVVGCFVNILDDKGNVYPLTDLLDGNYETNALQYSISIGTSYKIEIITPGGINIVSDFDQVTECPEVDSVYYIRKDIPTSNSEVFVRGIQFYVDLDAHNSTSHYFRWESVETFEYHSTWPREWYYDGQIHHIEPPDYSRFVCWRTTYVQNVYTLSTDNLAENKYKLLPIHFVDNKSSSRLLYGYSLLLRQLSLSEAGYNYWEDIRINTEEKGGMYDKQPLAIRGNLHNVTNSDQEVLGFFAASEMKSKRIFVSNVPDLPIEFDPNCAPSEPMRLGFAEITPEEYPAYLYGNKYGFQMRTLETSCVDCLTLGGVNVKPTFWPN